jgi:hypothetical protein
MVEYGHDVPVIDLRATMASESFRFNFSDIVDGDDMAIISHTPFITLFLSATITNSCPRNGALHCSFRKE